MPRLAVKCFTEEGIFEQSLEAYLEILAIKEILRCWPRVLVVTFSCSTAVAQGFAGFGSWARTWHHSSNHAEAASYMPQLEGHTTRIYNYVLGGFGEKKKETKRLRGQPGGIAVKLALGCSGPGFASLDPRCGPMPVKPCCGKHPTYKKKSR